MKTCLTLIILSLQLFSTILCSQEKKIDYYKVQEIINDRFGSSRTIYTASEYSLISTTDLGPGNERIITPVYRKERTKPVRVINSKSQRVLASKSKNNDIDNIPRNRHGEILGQKPDRSRNQNLNKNNSISSDSINNFNSLITDSSSKSIKAARKTAIPAMITENQTNNNDGIDKQSKREYAKPIEITPVNTVSVSKANPLVEDHNDSKINIKYTFLNQKNEIIEDAKLDAQVLEKEIENFKKHAVYEVENFEVANNDPNRIRPQFAYVRIFDTYERIAEKGYKSIVLFTKLSDYFYFGNQMEKAVKWYEKLFAVSKKLDSAYYYRYADALLKTGKTKKGNEMMEKYDFLMN